MKTNNHITPTSRIKDEPVADIIKIGIDVHKKRYVVVQQIDNSSLKPAQSFSPEQFMSWIGKQKQMAKQVYTCYETGCFGYVLHRKLLKMGVTNYVVRPRNWDDYGKGVKTDKIDAKELCSNLDRYVAGNKNAFIVVHAPTPEEEVKRSQSRLRDTLADQRKSLQNTGIGIARNFGHDISGGSAWWKERKFKKHCESLPEYLIELLTPIRKVILELAQQLKQVTEREENKAAELLPVGLGSLTVSILDQEVCDYHRFKNRRAVASYAGMIPSEKTTSTRRKQGSITKHGNPRIRHVLIEVAWRLVRFQPEYWAVKKWLERVQADPFNRALKKKMTVALGRRFFIDWWRIRTGQVKPEALGLVMGVPECASMDDKRREALASMLTLTKLSHIA